MDKTPKYIEMSEKTTKIQALWKPQDGDWFAIKKDLIAQSKHYAKKGEIYQVIHIDHAGIYFLKHTKGESGFSIRIANLFYLHQPEHFRLTWLPTQGQLQDMLKPRTRENQKYTRAYIAGDNPEGFITRCILADFFRWLEEKEQIDDYSLTSMEQLLLAFCMHELYKKNWDNEKREWAYLTKREREGYFPLTV